MMFDWMAFILEASTLFGRPRVISNAANRGYSPIDSYIVAQYLRVLHVKGVFPFFLSVTFLSEVQVKTNLNLYKFDGFRSENYKPIQNIETTNTQKTTKNWIPK